MYWSFCYLHLQKPVQRSTGPQSAASPFPFAILTQTWTKKQNSKSSLYPDLQRIYYVVDDRLRLHFLSMRLMCSAFANNIKIKNGENMMVIHDHPKLCSQYRSTTFQTLYHVLPWEIGIRPPGSATFKGDDCENRKLARAAHYRYPIDQDKSDWTRQTGQHATHSHSGVVPTVAAPIPYLICLSHENNTCISHILAT